MWQLSERILGEQSGTGTSIGIQYGFSVGVTKNHLLVGSPRNDVAATDR